MLGFCYLNPTLSQVKYEKEIRLNKEAIPQAAIDFISSLSFSKKVKWYKEFGLDNTSIEAKTKHEEKKYSIEFTPEGILEDVEIKIKSAEISSSVFANIQTCLLYTSPSPRDATLSRMPSSA